MRRVGTTCATASTARDPYSLPRIEGWERDLGSHDLKGKRAVIAPNLGSAVLLPAVEETVREAGEALAKDAGLQLVDIPVTMPGLGLEWAIANLATLLVDLGDRWPECKDDLSVEIAFGLEMAMGMMNLEMAATVERNRRAANETMADVFDQVDFVICATNPDVAYPAEVTLNTKVGDVSVGPENNGALTIPANICGNPACSIPAGTVDGLPVGLQVIGRHHEDALLLDLARIVEQERPWPFVAPNSPCLRGSLSHPLGTLVAWNDSSSCSKPMTPSNPSGSSTTPPRKSASAASPLLEPPSSKPGAKPDPRPA